MAIYTGVDLSTLSMYSAGSSLMSNRSAMAKKAPSTTMTASKIISTAILKFLLFKAVIHLFALLPCNWFRV